MANMNTILMHAFPYHAGPASLASALYKYTSCGAQLGVLTDEGWLCEFDQRTWNEYRQIFALSVGSIVEGVDETTDTIEVDCINQSCLQIEVAYDNAVTEVEEQAAAIWNDTHGCETCLEHWGLEGDDYGPIWDECPECGGGGDIL